MKFSTLFIICILGLAPGTGCQEGTRKGQANVESEPIDLKNIAFQRLNGDTIGLADYKGKVVFLNFWSTWCKPCIEEMPSIERAMDKLSDKGIVFLAASNESLEKIKKFKRRHDFSFEFVQLTHDFESLAVYALPTTIIYDRQGDVVINEAGAREWDAIDMVEKLSSL